MRSSFRCYYYMDQGLNKFSLVVYFLWVLTDEGFLCGPVCSPLLLTLLSSFHIWQAHDPGHGQLTVSSQDLHCCHCVHFYSLSTHGVDSPLPVVMQNFL